MVTEIELELTYLVKKLPAGLNDAKSIAIKDVFIPESADHAVLRLRQKGNKYEITKKVQAKTGDASSHYEYTIPLSREEYEPLAKSSHKDFVKIRYFIKINGTESEVDVYGEKLGGLVTIDFEFKTEEEKSNFVMPEVCLADVTQDEVIAGGYLAGKSFDDIAVRLKQYNYKKLGL